MKKFIFTFIAIVLLSANSAFAYNLNNFSDDYKIISALKVLEKNNQTETLSRLEKSNVQIQFYDLSQISYSYAKHFAVSTTDENGDNFILINQNFASSPKEALACLIAHESVHQLAHATYNEEVEATTTEAKTWILLRNQVTNSTQDALVSRLNKLAAMQSTDNKLIAKAISNSAFYQTQLAR